mmetsp:Transcript_1817/g.2622  ORF Transcript_1817/g.2622 Transcript_1817/m.2622 type:complete len:403 (-) Transcript_1817:135-1343(-)
MNLKSSKSHSKAGGKTKEQKAQKIAKKLAQKASSIYVQYLTKDSIQKVNLSADLLAPIHDFFANGEIEEILDRSLISGRSYPTPKDTSPAPGTQVHSLRRVRVDSRDVGEEKLITKSPLVEEEEETAILDSPHGQPDNGSFLQVSVRPTTNDNGSVGGSTRRGTQLSFVSDNNVQTSSQSPNLSTTAPLSKINDTPFESSFDVDRDTKAAEMKMMRKLSLVSNRNGDGSGRFRRMSTFSKAVENLLQGHTKVALEFLEPPNCDTVKTKDDKMNAEKDNVEMKETMACRSQSSKASTFSNTSRELLKNLLTIFIPAKDEVFRLMETDPHRRFVAKRHATLQIAINDTPAKNTHAILRRDTNDFKVSFEQRTGDSPSPRTPNLHRESGQSFMRSKAGSKVMVVE